MDYLILAAIWLASAIAIYAIAAFLFRVFLDLRQRRLEEPSASHCTLDGTLEPGCDVKNPSVDNAKLLKENFDVK